jgi:hypothetical protein
MPHTIDVVAHRDAPEIDSVGDVTLCSDVHQAVGKLGTDIDDLFLALALRLIFSNRLQSTSKV